MSRQSITLELPDELYDRVREIAAAHQLDIESVLVDSIALMFGELDKNALETATLTTLSDEQLWAIVHRHLAYPQDARQRELGEKADDGTLTDDERAETIRLAAQVDRYVLLRSQALLLLKQRGYDVEQRLRLGA
ncbi:MAG: hypothetical protein IT320_07735 [Anaerolineae bacterium]|nr:hypothetical protein [Anaerolineae bacterium]